MTAAAPLSSSPVPASPPGDLLGRLEDICHHRGVADLATRLGDLRAFVGSDLADVESALRALPSRDTPMHRSAHHLLGMAGKRLRPLCVALAARAGDGFGDAARELAVAVELVHSATLLHDDVVDLGDRRRGVEAARVVYGNAASIFGGDWLLVEALRRTRATGLADVFDRLLGVLLDMLDAEGLQLARRGATGGTEEDYLRVVEGKTASLFRWGLYAGARAGNLAPGHCAALEDFGLHLGVAFQVMDDVLDVAGDPDVVGKTLFADLREGKLTYPLLVAWQRDPSVRALVTRAAATTEGPVDPAVRAAVAEALRATRAVDDSVRYARERSALALDRLVTLPPSPSRDALEGVVLATLHRNK